MTELAEPYTIQSRWSDPGPHAAWLAAIPPAPQAVVRHVSNLVTHCLTARLRGLAVPERALRDVEVRTAAGMLERVVARDAGPTTRPRGDAERFWGVCAHFALLAAAVLRLHGVPARSRVGFARYFVPGSFEDHWVTEYWQDGEWKLLDAQLDDATLAALGIRFRPWDVPRDQFVDASTAWRRMRAGDIPPDRVGVTVIGLTGPWFAAQSVLRDVAALNREETLPWDTWGPGREVGPHAPEVPAAFAARIDTIADRVHGTPSAELAARVYGETPWLRVTPTILTLAFERGWPDGVPAELTL